MVSTGGSRDLLFVREFPTRGALQGSYVYCTSRVWDRKGGRGRRRNMQGAVRGVVAAQCGVAAAAAAYFMTRGGGDRSSSRLGQSSVEPVSTDRVLHAAGSIVKACRSYGFVCTTSGGSGAPDCRIMDLHRLSESTLEFGLVSRAFTRKASALREMGACTIAFHDPRGGGEAGYLVLSGDARELKSPEECSAVWKPAWSFFHPGPHAEDVVQWRFVPTRLELVSHLHGLTDDWAPVRALRDAKQPEAPWTVQPRRAYRRG